MAAGNNSDSKSSSQQQQQQSSRYSAAKNRDRNNNMAGGATITGLSPRSEVTFAIVAYSFCSGTLVLLNKLILHFLPYPSLVVSFQLAAAIIFIYTAKFTGVLEVDPIKWEFVLPYLAYTVAFSLGVYCNMRSLSISNVETVIVFRALTPVLVAFLDFMFLGRELPNARSWTGLFIIILGAYGYASFDEKFQTQGLSAYMWPFLYLIIISFEMCYGKQIIRSVALTTLSGPVLYTNLLGIFPMLLFASAGNEYNRFWADFWEKEKWGVPPAGMALLLLGCIAGTGIGYSSWWCRDKVSATSFTLIGVMNKCLTILLNVFVWDKHAPPGGIASLFICLVGGMIYQQSPMRSTSSNNNVTLLPTSKIQPSASDEDGAWHDSVSTQGDEPLMKDDETMELIESEDSNGATARRRA